jgi:hypothetical protein
MKPGEILQGSSERRTRQRSDRGARPRTRRLDKQTDPIAKVKAGDFAKRDRKRQELHSRSPGSTIAKS